MLQMVESQLYTAMQALLLSQVDLLADYIESCCKVTQRSLAPGPTGPPDGLIE